MIDSRTAPYAALLLRVSLAILFFAHAGLKILVFTPAGTAKFFGSVGMPPELAYVVMSAEVLAAIALLLGVWTRVAALLATPILLGLGVTELSTTASIAPEVKARVRSLSLDSCRSLAAQALDQTSPEAVRALVKSFGA